MDLQLSEEQRLFKESVDRFVAQSYDSTRRKRIVESPQRFSPEVWQSMAELGWLALPLPEEDGGLGGSAVDVGILMEGLGKGLVLEPLCESSVLAGRLLASLGSSAQRRRWLTPLGDGSARAAFAHLEGNAGPYAMAAATTAAATRDGWRIDGRKTPVFDASGADFVLVSARLEGAPGTAGQTAQGVGVLVVPAGTAGMQDRAGETIDDRRVSTLSFDGVEVPGDHLLGGSRDAAASIALALDHAVAAGCAEAVGCMQAMLDATVEYTKTRVQFGEPLATRQVLRHRMVDMAVQCEEARAMALRAALLCDDADARRRGLAVSGARAKVAAAGRFVAEAAVQVHGAMGVTDELDIGAYFKRLLRLEKSWGTRADHLARYTRLRQEQ